MYIFSLFPSYWTWKKKKNHPRYRTYYQPFFFPTLKRFSQAQVSSSTSSLEEDYNEENAHTHTHTFCFFDFSSFHLKEKKNFSNAFSMHRYTRTDITWCNRVISLSSNFFNLKEFLKKEIRSQKYIFFFYNKKSTIFFSIIRKTNKSAPSTNIPWNIFVCYFNVIFTFFS